MTLNPDKKKGCTSLRESFLFRILFAATIGMHHLKIWRMAVGDPEFPQGGGADHPGDGANIRFCQNFPKIFPKKEFEPGGRGVGMRPKFHYVDPTLEGKEK